MSMSQAHPALRTALSLTVAAGLAGAAFLGGREILGGAAATQGPVTSDPVPVNLRTLEFAEGHMATRRHAGTVVARRSGTLAFDMPGRVERVAVREGDRIAEGEVLAVLDTDRQRAELARLRAQLAAAEADARLAASTLSRQDKLAADGHAAVQRLDEARAARAAALAAVAAAKAAIDSLEVDLRKARLLAPYDLIVTARHADKGAVVSPGAPLLSVIEAGAPEAHVGLPTDLSSRLTPGETYPVRVGATLLRARLKSLVPDLDRTSRTLTAVFVLPEEGPVVGDLARLEIEEWVSGAGAWVPLTALSEGRRGLWSLMIAQPNGEELILRRADVEILHSDGGRAFVRGPMDDGARVAVAGVQRLAPGMSVRAEPELGQ